RQGAGERAQERGLAGAVGADHRDGLALPYLERDAEERLEVAVERRQVANGEEAHVTSIPRETRRTSGLAITASGGPSIRLRPKCIPTGGGAAERSGGT